MSVYRKLTISAEPPEAILLGYRLELTPSEHAILYLLAAFPNRGFSRKEISLLIFKKEDLPSVPVHVCSLNKKAFPISGRRLIVCPKGLYMLNESL